jgi:hypothetical protein
MCQYEIYIQLENIETQIILFTYRYQQWRPDEAQQWEAAHNLKLLDNEKQLLGTYQRRKVTKGPVFTRVADQHQATSSLAR